jgi:cytochrome c oxidase subunit 2
MSSGGHAVIRSTRRTRTRRLVTRVISGGFLLASVTACELPSFGFPKGITPQAQRIYNIWSGSVIAALIVGVGVWGMIFWASFAYRKKSDELPKQVRYNLPVEILYTVVPFVIVGGLFYYTARDESKIDEKPKADMTVSVVGIRWSWQFGYIEKDSAGKDVLTAQVTGRPGQPPVLVLPTNRSILFKETSQDVIHSFWVIEFNFKRDVIPGRTNEFEISKITKTGTFVGRCAELCGVDHDRMNFIVKVVPEKTFDAYVASNYNPKVLDAASASTAGSGS